MFVVVDEERFVIAADEGRVMFDVERGREANCAAHILNVTPIAMSHIGVYSCRESILNGPFLESTEPSEPRYVVWF